MHQCHHCKRERDSDRRQPGIKECCESCGAYLHCCKNCRFHSPNSHNQCYIPNTESVGDRHKLNFCDEFEFASDTGDNTANQKQAEARKGALELLGDDDTETKPTSFDDLFN
jgi:hypothetical protein